MSCTVKMTRDAHYYHFNKDMYTELLQLVGQRHYPHRIPPDKWPDMKLIGKAMARGWAVPCRYYPIMRMRGGFCRTFIFPGISDMEYGYILAIMKQEE